MVGGISARYEDKEGKKVLYIMTIGVLEPYRRLKIGTKLIEWAEEECKKNKATEIYLHVWTPNTEALSFYERLGYTNKEKLTNYYRRLVPPDCYYLTKEISL